jgi:uncharacterized membrane protein YcgQ (UPF0703/DUF1980 family)
MKKIINIVILVSLLAVLVVLISQASRRPAQTNGAPLNNSDYTQLDIYNTLFGKSQTEKIKLLARDQITLQGKVLKSSFLKNDEIVVYRIVITCCVADGVPLGIIVKIPPDFEKPLHDKDWVNVEGTLKLLPFNQLNPKLLTSGIFANMVLPKKEMPYFVAANMVKMAKVPGDEYLYP